MGKTIQSPDGELMRLIIKHSTTRATDACYKPIVVDTQEIEVLIFDFARSWGSWWGHVAIVIGDVCYSRAHEKYRAFAGKDKDAYIRRNREIRAVEGLVLRVSTKERKIVEDELKLRVNSDKPYNILGDSCSTNVADVLEKIGILAHDPRFFFAPSSDAGVSPKEMLLALSRSKRLARRNHYPKFNKND